MTYDQNNIFAKILRGEMPCEKVYEDAHALAFMDIMPRADGHTLVISKAPARNLLDIQPDDLKNLIVAVQHVARGVKQAMQAPGLMIQQFNEPAGGQVVFHIHVHIIPRFEGVPLRPHTGQMADAKTLQQCAEKIRACL